MMIAFSVRGWTPGEVEAFLTASIYAMIKFVSSGLVWSPFRQYAPLKHGRRAVSAAVCSLFVFASLVR